ncbi:hypothetical protein M9H77_22363 [Catharanthus roseus]|uniref:Uncharacterized protein n=1 Tax=Catharanthus roseus TaxID=4058 RepID=A0ACC0AQA5_CATRO|nr:hypothetical protein M9H77_22363 [Catharanthus roseus]
MTSISVARLGASGYHNWIGCIAWRINFKNCQSRILFRNILTKSESPTKSRTVGLYFVNIILAASQKVVTETNEMLVKMGVARASFVLKAIKLATLDTCTNSHVTQKKEHSNKFCEHYNEETEGRTCWNLTCYHESKISAIVHAE